MSMNINRNMVVLRAEGIYRRFFMQFFADKESSFLVTEYPKSGGTWLTSMVSEVCEVDFPRNRFPNKRASAFQGHYVRRYGQKRIIVLWRDPRDIVVSYYHHAILGNSHTNREWNLEMRKKCGIENADRVIDNLPIFIEHLFSGNLAPRYVTWSDFYDYWYDRPDVLHVSYEGLRSDTLSNVKRIASYLNVDVSDGRLFDIVKRNSFEAKTGRKPGEPDNQSFVRKGIVGDWVNFFSEESLTTLRRHVGDRPVNLGYIDGWNVPFGRVAEK